MSNVKITLRINFTAQSCLFKSSLGSFSFDHFVDFDSLEEVVLERSDLVFKKGQVSLQFVPFSLAGQSVSDNG